MENFETIEKFIDNELDGEELEDFKRLLPGNKDLSDEITLHLQVDEAIMDNGVIALKNQLASIHKSLHNVKKVRPIPHRPFLRSWYLAAATIALIIILVGTVYVVILRNHTYSNDELFHKYYDPYEVVINVRSGNFQCNDLFVQALQKYQKHDYSGALAFFEKIIMNDSTNVACNFYSGISFMETTRYMNAIKSFNSVIWQNDNLFLEQTEWYLGLCYLKTNKMNQAVKQFKKISASNSFYKDKSNSILESIN
ncbi:MAG: hypothetical protein NTW49_01140 [Bacteroidia bacterium]|nr:hypothetical protein [Bacteroidia bacterium]